jgi:hypothetical protein
LAISTYAELLTAIQNYENDTSSIVTDRDDEWVTLCEQRIHYGSGVPGQPFYSPPLRIRAMEQAFTIRIEANQAGGTSGGSANAQTVTLAVVPTVALGLTITFTAGFTNTGATTLNPNALGAVAIRKGVNNDALESADIVLGAEYTVYFDGTFYKLMPSAGGAPLPSRYLGFKSIYDDGDKNRMLDYFPAHGMSGLEGVNSAGIVRGYTIDGDCIRLISLPDSTRFLRGTYYRRFADLSTELNELFRRAPSVYLYGSLLEAALYLGEDEHIIKWHGMYSAACGGVASSNRFDRIGAGPLVMRPQWIV